MIFLTNCLIVGSVVIFIVRLSRNALFVRFGLNIYALIVVHASLFDIDNDWSF